MRTLYAASFADDAFLTEVVLAWAKKPEEGRVAVDAVVVIVAVVFFALSWGLATALHRL
jgi:hypothetical protein